MASAQPLRTALAALLIVLAAWPADALQIGDTKAHILARHGTPAAEDTANNLSTYSWDGWTAQLTFREGLVEKLAYRKNIPLQESEIVSLLQSNGGRNRWREAASSDGVRCWERDDGAFAEFGAGEAMGMVFFKNRPRETIPTPAPAPASGSVPAPIPTPAPAPTAAPAPVSAPALTFAQTAASTRIAEPAPIETPIVTSGRSLPPIMATPVVSVETPPLPAMPKIEALPTPVETVGHEPAPPRPTVLVAVEEPAREIAVATEAEIAEPVELKPIAHREPKFRVSSAQAHGPAVPVPAPANVVPGKNPSGFGVIAIFTVLTGLITGLALFLRKRLVSKPRALPLNAVSRTSTASAHRPVRAAASIPALDALRWDQFELLVAETYRREDFIVEISAGVDAEGGTDLTLRRDSETFLVQCKHWKTACVAEREVREFYGMMAATGAPQGIIATLGAFSRDAQTFAAEKGIELLDRAALEKRIEAMARPDEDFCAVDDWIEEFTARARIFDPECPVCNGSMVVRQSRVGGAASWGCRSYPRCPGKREPRPDLLAAAAGR